jgi:hypothetical protein
MPDTSLENKDVAPKGQGQRKLDLKDKGSKHQESIDKESKDRGPKIGKIDLNTFQSFLLKRLGKEDRAVLVPSLTVVDAGVIDTRFDLTSGIMEENSLQFSIMSMAMNILPYIYISLPFILSLDISRLPLLGRCLLLHHIEQGSSF